MIRPAHRALSPLLVVALGAALAGCNSNAAPVAAAQTAAVEPGAGPSAAPVVALPPGAACTGEIGRWRKLIEADYQSGNVDPTVYAAAEQEIGNAQSDCAAGHDGQAVHDVQDSRRKHGYPAG